MDKPLWTFGESSSHSTYVSKKLYPSAAASFLPTEDLPVPIIPTKKTEEPSRTSLTSAPVSAEASHRTIDRRERRAAVWAGRTASFWCERWSRATGAT